MIASLNRHKNSNENLAIIRNGDWTLRKSQRLKKARKLAFRLVRVSCLLGFCALLYACLIEPNWLEINRLHLNLPHLASEFNGYRIVQISDIHTDKWTNQKRLNRIFRLVNQQKPDLVVITGDLVTRHSQAFTSNLKIALAQLTPVDKTVAIFGNHDYEADPQAINQALEQTDIATLHNAIYTLHRGNAMLHIAGVEDVCMGKERLDLVLKQLPSDGAAILLAHEPDFADTSAATGRFDLQLSGHSHAGQVRLPFFKPLILPNLAHKYYSGCYLVKKMLLYTNSGIGMTGLHLRFGSRPEITVLTLVANG
jgi:uncharacterized protein